MFVTAKSDHADDRIDRLSTLKHCERSSPVKLYAVIQETLDVMNLESGILALFIRPSIRDDLNDD